MQLSEIMFMLLEYLFHVRGLTGIYFSCVGPPRMCTEAHLQLEDPFWYRRRPACLLLLRWRFPSDEYLVIAALLLQERGAFTLVLSGGSLLKAVGQLVGAPGVDFSKWHVFFVDERNVPHSHPDSNFKGADEALLSKVC